MRRTLKFLMAATAVVLPSAAHAQACTAVQLAANPLVALGYQAFVRINNTGFDLSCYYQNLGSNQIGFSTVPQVALGSGTSAITAQVNQAIFTSGPNVQPFFNYGVSSNINTAAASSNDFVWVFASPLATNVYNQADAQIGVTRASGNPVVSIVPGGAPSTVPIAGYPAYLVAQSTFLDVSGGGTTSNPFATNLGVDVGGSSCSVGTACAYAPASSTPSASISAYGTRISYRQSRPGSTASNAQANGQINLAAVPEPATLTLMATGILALAGIGYSRRRGA